MTPIPRLLAWLLPLLLLGACTSYRYIPPTTDAGRQCVVSCETNRQICISGKEQVAASQAQACELRRANQLNACLATAFTPQLRAQCGKKAPSCSSHASTGACDTSHRACYVQCGGQVVEVED